MNYSKKHLKALLCVFLFNGGGFKGLSHIFGRDRRELCSWDGQREHSLYRKCERKAKR